METTNAIKYIKNKLLYSYNEWFYIYSEKGKIIVITTQDLEYDIEVYNLRPKNIEMNRINDIESYPNYQEILIDLFKLFSGSTPNSANLARLVP